MKVLGKNSSDLPKPLHLFHLVVERYKEGAQALYRRVGFVAHDREVMTKAIG